MTIALALRGLSVLGILFVVLKLTGVIGWSWLWVLLPFWGPLVLVGAVTFFVFISAIVFAFFSK